MSVPKNIPKAKGFDLTLRLLRTGYPFIPDLMTELNTDIFRTRIMGKKSVCITGKDAVRLFYDPAYMIRHGANPMRVQKTLFGVNAIQGMDGDAHLHRRQQFLSILTPDHICELQKIMNQKYQQSIKRWTKKDQISLFQESATLLCEGACEWCCIPITRKEARKRAHQFMQMVFAIGSIGPQYWAGKSARHSTERWITSIIQNVRDGKLVCEPDSALYQFAYYTDSNGKCLNAHAAAIELINVIRPIVAVSIYIVYAALAIHDYPACEERLMHNYPSYYQMFVQEVRRYYPVGPFLGARTKKMIIWHDYIIPKNMLVFLDVYGINQDPAIWKYPTTFHPENFLNWENDLYELIPQGGGDPKTGHRCPGEQLTIVLMKDAIDFLVNQIQYTVPHQNLHYSLQRIPTLPASGFLMTNIKEKIRS